MRFWLCPADAVLQRDRGQESRACKWLQAMTGMNEKTRRKAGSLRDIYLQDYMFRRMPTNRLVVLSSLKWVPLTRMANFLVRS